MRKHIYGFALFVFIVASGAIAYTLFHPMAEINMGSGTRGNHPRAVVSEPAPVGKALQAGRLEYEIKSLTVDLNTNRGTAVVELYGRSKDILSRGFDIGFGIVTADQPHGGSLIGWSGGEGFVSDESLSETRTFTFPLEEGSRRKFDPEKNYYGFLHMEPGATDFRGDDLDGTRDFMYGLVPVLVRHPNKK
jgi:hypothetical protein